MEEGRRFFEIVYRCRESSNAIRAFVSPFTNRPSQRYLCSITLLLVYKAMMKVAGCILLSLGLAEAFAPSSLGFGTRKMTSQLSMAAEGAEPVLNKYSRYVAPQ
jgi:hypothetical protein